jgi:hypothetical protein
MSERKDKKKVLGETFDDARILSFLTLSAPAGVDADYHCLEIAYRGMHHENFATFVRFFVEAGRNLHAKGPRGLTFREVIASHRHGQDYLDALTPYESMP